MAKCLLKRKTLPYSCQANLNNVHITLPIITVSEANSSESWPKRARRHKLQQRAIFASLLPNRKFIGIPCKIALTRYGPRKLDKHDNLPMSLKYIVDAICAVITGNYTPGRGDDDERISISYDQVTSAVYGVKILITS